MRILARHRERARRARLPARGRGGRADERQIRDAPLPPGARDWLARRRGSRTSCPPTSPIPVLVKARRGFGVAQHLPRREPGGARLLPRAHPGGVVRAGGLRRRGVLDGRLLRPRRPCLNSIPRTMIESKGGESIKGMTIADEELVALGRDVSEALGVVGPATVQCFRAAPRRLQGDGRESPLRRRLPAAARGGRRVPGARARARTRGDVRSRRVGGVPGRRRHDAVLLRDLPRARRGRHALAVVAVGLRAPPIPFPPGSGWLISLAFVSPRRLCCWPRSSWAPRPATARATSPWPRTRLATPPRRPLPPCRPDPRHDCPRRGRGYGQAGAASSRRRPRRRDEGDAERRGGSRRPAPPLSGPCLRSGLRRAHCEARFPKPARPSGRGLAPLTPVAALRRESSPDAGSIGDQGASSVSDRRGGESVGGLMEFPATTWEGVAYVHTMGGMLRAISMQSGRVLWKRDVGSLVASSPAIDPERRRARLDVDAARLRHGPLARRRASCAGATHRADRALAGDQGRGGLLRRRRTGTSTRSTSTRTSRAGSSTAA